MSTYCVLYRMTVALPLSAGKMTRSVSVLREVGAVLSSLDRLGFAVAEKQHETSHTILFENSKVLPKAPHFYDRKIREAIEIHKCPHNINRDNGYYLSNIWKPTLDAIARLSSPTPPGVGQSPSTTMVSPTTLYKKGHNHILPAGRVSHLVWLTY